MVEVDSLYETVAAVLGVETAALDEDSSPETIASWDSVNHLNLVMALESEFSVRLSADDALSMRSIRVIRELLKRTGSKL